MAQDTSTKVQIKLLSEDAQVPVYSTSGSAGCDIYAIEDFVIPYTKTEIKVSDEKLIDIRQDLKNLKKFYTPSNETTEGVNIFVKGSDKLEEQHNEDYFIDKVLQGFKDLVETATITTNIGITHAKSGIAVGIPVGSNIEMELRGRSGLAFKQNVDSFNGTVDEDFKQEINILMYNYTDKDIVIKKGERVCQAVFKKIEQVDFEKVDEINPEVLDNPARRTNNSIKQVERVDGLGHTGN